MDYDIKAKATTLVMPIHTMINNTTHKELNVARLACLMKQLLHLSPQIYFTRRNPHIPDDAFVLNLS